MIDEIKVCLEGSAFIVQIKIPDSRNQWIKGDIVMICIEWGKYALRSPIISFMSDELKTFEDVEKKIKKVKKDPYVNSADIYKIEELLKPLYRKNKLDNIFRCLNELKPI